MRTLVFFNHAGGVAKTSSVRDIGFSLAEQGFKVLLIDADPQANLSEWLGLLEPAPLEQTIFNAVISNGRDRAELRLPEPLRVHNLDLIPSQLDLARIDLLLNVRMILGELLELTIAEKIGPAVSHLTDQVPPRQQYQHRRRGPHSPLVLLR